MDRSQRILRRPHQCDKKPASASGAARRRAKFLSLDEAPKLRERWNMAPFLMFDVWFPTHVLFCGEWREFLRNTSSLLEYRSWWLSSTHNSTKTSKSISFPLNLLTYALIDIDPLAYDEMKSHISTFCQLKPRSSCRKHCYTDPILYQASVQQQLPCSWCEEVCLNKR